MRQIESWRPDGPGPGGVVFSVIDGEGRALVREICTPDPDEVVRYYARSEGRVAGVAWRFGPLQRWRSRGGWQLPEALHEPEFRRVQGCAYRCLAGYLERCALPRLAIAASMSRYGGYYPDLYTGTRAMVGHELASSLAFLVDSIDVEVLAERLVMAQGLEAFTLPRYPGDEVDALPPGIFLLQTM